MGGSSRSSGGKIRNYLLTVGTITLVLSAGCGGASETGDQTRAVAVTDTTSNSAPRALRIADPIPPFVRASDPGVDSFAFQVNLLTRENRMREIGALEPAALTLVRTASVALAHADRRVLGTAMVRLNRALQVESSADASLRYCQTLCKRWDQRWSPPDSMGAELIALQANALNAMGRNSEAVLFYREAADRLSLSGHAQRGAAHLRAGAYSALEGKDQEAARRLFAEAIDIHSTGSFVDTSLWTAAILSSIAADSDSVLPRLALAKRLLPGVNNALVAGFYHSRRGQYLGDHARSEEAVHCFIQAIEAIDTLEEKSVEQAQALASYLHNAAYGYWSAGDAERAKPFGTKAIAVNEALLRIGGPLVARSANDRLAGNLEILPLDDAAARLYGTGPDRQRSVLKIRLARKPVDSVLVAKTFCNLAADLHEADPLLADSILKYAELCLAWPSRAETASALQLKAHALAIKGHRQEALAALEKAVGLSAGKVGFRWSELGTTDLSPTVSCAVQLGAFEEVLERLEEEDEEIRAHGLLGALSAKQSALIDDLFVVEGTDLAKLTRSRQYMTARLLRAQWPAPGQLVGSEAADRLLVLMDDEKAMVYRRERFLKDQAREDRQRQKLGLLREEMEAMRIGGRQSNDPEMMVITGRIDSLQQALAQAPPPDTPPTLAHDGFTDRLRAVLDEKTAILEYRLTDREVFLALIAKDTLALDRFERTAAMESHLARYASLGTALQPDHDSDEAGSLALERLIPGFVRDGRYAHLVIIPSNELCFVPFEALRIPDVKAAPGKSRLLIDAASVSYALSANVFLDHEPQPVQADLDVLAFAPDYGMGHGGDGYEENRRSANVLLRSAEQATALPLLHNAEEVKAIGGWVKAVPLLGDAANEVAFKRAMEGAGVLHLAMHASSSEDPMRCGLVFGPVSGSSAGTQRSASASGPEDDGIFHAYELLNRELKAELVVLSACETGHGIHEDGEGVRSLARGFLLAGAGSTVSSLWKVDDRATKEIMVKFYEQLAEGMGKADALAEAKRWYRKENPNAPPSHWAAFILIGDNEPVHLKKRSPVRPWMFAIGLLLLSGGAYLALRKRRARMAA